MFMEDEEKVVADRPGADIPAILGGTLAADDGTWRRRRACTQVIYRLEWRPL